MTITMIRARVKDEHVEEIEDAVRRTFKAIDAAAPAGVKYASSRAADGSFVVLLSLEGDENPLVAIPEFREFQAALPGWMAGQPAVEQLDVLGSYDLF